MVGVKDGCDVSVESMSTTALERQHGRAGMARVRLPGVAPYAPYLFIPLTIALVVWFFYVAFATYNFIKPQTLDLRPYQDVFTALPRNLNLVALLIVFLASAIGPGNLFLMPLRLQWRDAAEETLFSLATGLIVYTFGILVLGTAGFLQRWVCFTILALGSLLTIWYAVRRYQHWRHERQAVDARADDAPALHIHEGRRIGWGVWLGALLALYFYVALLGALSPETQFDARYYHLGQARSYAAEGRIYNYVKETRIIVAALDPYQAILYADLWKMSGMIEAKLLHWGDALVTALALIYFCRAHFRSALMGMVAALIFISTPVISWSAGTGGDDLQLCLYTLLSVHAFLRWKENPRSMRWLVVLGLMSGYAFASKANGLFNMVILFGGVLVFAFLTLREARTIVGAAGTAIRYVGVAGMSALAACLPWLIRSYVETGNPFFPSFNNIIHSPYYDPHVEGLIPVSAVHHLQSLVQPILTYTWNSLTTQITYRAVLGPVFIVALPVCVWIYLFTGRSRIGAFRLLSGYVAIWMGVWLIWGTLVGGLYELRYAEAILPVMAALVAFPLIVQHWPGWQGSVFRLGFGLIVALITFLNFQPVVPFQKAAADPIAFSAPRVSFAYLYEGAPEGSVQLQYIPMIYFINQHLVKGDKVYDYSALALYASYTDVKFFSATPALGSTLTWDLFSPDALQHFKEEHITYVSVLVSDMDRLRQAAIFPSLHAIQQTADGQVLLRVNDGD